MSKTLAGLAIPPVPTGDYELDQLIRGYQAGALDEEGTELLMEELAEHAGWSAVPEHRNDLGDGCPYGSMDPHYTEDGTCPQYCHEADVLVGFDAGDRELPDDTDLPDELSRVVDGVRYAVHPGREYPELDQ
jgi:hypothetical protein